MTNKADDDTRPGWNPNESAYEGRTDNPAPDTDAARRGPASGAGAQQPGGENTHTDAEKEGGGARHERE